MTTKKNTSENLDKNITFKSRLSSVPLDVTVVLGQQKMSVHQVMNLGLNSIIELDKREGDPVEIRVNNRVVGQGSLTLMGDKVGVTITSVVGVGDDE